MKKKLINYIICIFLSIIIVPAFADALPASDIPDVLQLASSQGSVDKKFSNTITFSALEESSTLLAPSLSSAGSSRSPAKSSLSVSRLSLHVSSLFSFLLNLFR